MSMIGKSVSSSFMNRALRTSNVAKRLAASPSRSLSTITVDIGEDAFSTHSKQMLASSLYFFFIYVLLFLNQTINDFFDMIVFDRPDTTVTTSKEELLQFMKEMYTMRRMEITNDTEYKVLGVLGRPATSDFTDCFCLRKYLIFLLVFHSINCFFAWTLRYLKGSEHPRLLPLV